MNTTKVPMVIILPCLKRPHFTSRRPQCEVSQLRRPFCANQHPPQPSARLQSTLGSARSKPANHAQHRPTTHQRVTVYIGNGAPQRVRITGRRFNRVPAGQRSSRFRHLPVHHLEVRYENAQPVELRCRPRDERRWEVLRLTPAPTHHYAWYLTSQQ